MKKILFCTAIVLFGASARVQAVTNDDALSVIMSHEFTEWGKLRILWVYKDAGVKLDEIQEGRHPLSRHFSPLGLLKMRSAMHTSDDHIIDAAVCAKLARQEDALYKVLDKYYKTDKPAIFGYTVTEFKIFKKILELEADTAEGLENALNKYMLYLEESAKGSLLHQ
jgi:hypothetical protein